MATGLPTVPTRLQPLHYLLRRGYSAAGRTADLDQLPQDDAPEDGPCRDMNGIGTYPAGPAGS